MKKIISFVLVLSLVLVPFAFASAEDAPLADVAGTKYEDAVNELLDKGIVTGYTDGTFRPDSTINRAEACIIVVKALGVSEVDLDKAVGGSFPDLNDFGWAEKYINYAASKGIVTGYTDGTFKPTGDVKYAEMAAMLVRALGYKIEDLTGVWPSNFMDKAIELGLMKGVYGKANEKAIRGDVALMGQKALWEIEEKAEDGKDEDGKTDNPLADFSGRAYGVLLDVARVLNDKGKAVDEYEFLFGSKTIYLKTNGSVADPSASVDIWLASGAAVGLQMNGGVVTKLGHSEESPTPFAGIGSPSGFENLAGAWNKVTDVKSHYIETQTTVAGRNGFTILDDASVYVAKIEGGKIVGYKSGTIRDVSKGSEVRIFAITGKNPYIGEVVLVKK